MLHTDRTTEKHKSQERQGCHWWFLIDHETQKNNFFQDLFVLEREHGEGAEEERNFSKLHAELGA